MLPHLQLNVGTQVFKPISTVLNSQPPQHASPVRCSQEGVMPVLRHIDADNQVVFVTSDFLLELTKPLHPAKICFHSNLLVHSDLLLLPNSMIQGGYFFARRQESNVLLSLKVCLLDELLYNVRDLLTFLLATDTLSLWLA